MEGHGINILGTIMTTVKDKNGVITHCDRKRMDSWVDNFAAIFHLIVNMVFPTGAGHLPKNTSGVSMESITCLGHTYGGPTVPGISADDTRGIKVGTSDLAHDHTMVALTAPIAEGTGSGQLMHIAESAVSPVWNGSTKWTCSKSRDFINHSGASIIVKEIGIYHNDINAPNIFMLARDVVAPITVGDGSTLTVEYSFDITA